MIASRNLQAIVRSTFNTTFSKVTKVLTPVGNNLGAGQEQPWLKQFYLHRMPLLMVEDMATWRRCLSTNVNRRAGRTSIIRQQHTASMLTNEIKVTRTAAAHPYVYLSLGAALGVTGLAVAYTPFFEYTREGIRYAWNWNKLYPKDIDNVAENELWRFWIGAMGMIAGFSASRGLVNRAVARDFGAFLIPIQIPFIVFSGVLGAKLTTSTAHPIAEFVVLIGRLAEFSTEGFMADWFGKPRNQLPWIQKTNRSKTDLKWHDETKVL
jgi:hypothetical protein